MRRLWITDDPYPATAETVALAEQAGATEIVHGATFVGYVEEPDPETQSPTDLADPDADRLVVAEEARRTAYDEVIAGGTLSMSRINQANRAGMDAYLAALDT